MQKGVYLFLSLFFLVALNTLVQAQILDDSTKQVYGPTTTRYFYETSVIQERDTLFVLDTTLVGLQHFSVVDKYGRRLQDLGNLGTAIRPIFFDAPREIGLTSGYNAYDYYFVSPEAIQYFDSRSPYSKVAAVFGAHGRSMVDVDFSRNINPRWNFGLDFKRVTADRQIGATGFSQDKHTFSTAYDVYTAFITKDSTYRVLANVSRLKQEVNESGGIAPYTDTGEQEEIPGGLFDYEEENVWLQNAKGSELRINSHIYHQYKLSSLISLFHKFDMLKQEVTFEDELSSDTLNYYEHKYIDLKTTAENSIFRSVTNMVGVKGDFEGFFYQLYYKRRGVDFTPKYLPPSKREIESYGGFDISYLQENLGKVGFFGEYLLGGNYKVGARLTSKWLAGSIQRVRSEVPYLFRQYFGNHDEWYNDFEPMVTDELKGAINVEVGPLLVRPRASISNVNRYLYFDEAARPAQSGSFSQILSPGVDLKITFFRNIHFETAVTYTAVTGDSKDNIRIPPLFANASLYYTNFVFKKKLQLRGGFEGHFQTAYYAHDYDPVTMQFYLQNNFELPQYYTADFFVNFKISSARIFFKITNFTQMVGLTEGYFTTPFYTGQRGSVDFGFNWMFYD